MMEQVELYTDPEVEILKLEIINLENEIGQLATEKGEIWLANFTPQYYE